MRLFILLSLWLLPTVIFSQSCGLFDTIPIPAGNQGDIIIPITDYFNNDLSDPLQGLCGVEINFVHNFSENLEISLTSPSGQSIDLIGPNTNDPTAFTFLAKWKITFVPCNETAFPDPGYLAQWNNNQPNNFVNGGQYSGSYYPFNGCLETFNTGPVNGDWVIHFTNQPTYFGAFTYIRLIFCDNRGVDCCFADPGLFTNKEIISCQGDSSLLIEPEIIFETIAPDTAIYDYTYTIAQDSLLIAYESSINLINYPSGQYQICGLSYKIEDLSLLPSLDGTLRIDTLYNRLNSFTSPFCGQLSDSCILVNIAPPIPTTDISFDLCQGDTIVMGDSLLTTNGLHPIHLLSEIGCDSLVNVNINLLPIPFVQLDSTICRGDTAQIGLHKYYNSGIYQDTLNTSHLQCDSIVQLNLTVLEPIFTTTDTTICQGSSYSVGDSTYYAAGTYEILLASHQGCDSTVILNLEILDPVAIISTPDTLNCNQPTITLSAAESSPANLTFLWKNNLNEILGTTETIPVSATGQYQLTIGAMANNIQCVASDTIIVYDNFDTPISDAGLKDTITCTLSELTLGGNNTTQGDSIQFQWIALSGNITGDPNILFTTVNEPGEYQLTTTNTKSGCFSQDSVKIAIDTIPPTLNLQENLPLNCQNRFDTIFTTGASSGADFSYHWTSSDCGIDIVNQSFLEVNCEGKYFLSIDNTQNGCRQIDSIEVMIDTISPSVIIPLPDTLTCSRQSVLIDASNTSPINTLYNWQGPGLTGTITTPSIEVNINGDYQLIIENNSNFCKDTSTITVEIDTISPLSDAGINQSITCYQPTVTIGGGQTSTGSEFQYVWTTFDSQITGQSDLITLQTDTSGTFLLEVINTNNGCRDTTDVQVFLDNEPPYVNAGNPMEFNCGDNQLTLQGAVDISLPNLQSSWSGPCLLTPNDQLTVDIECAGTYYLEAFNEDNGCTNIDSVIIGVNPAALFAILPDTTYISCETGEAVIEGGNSSLAILDWQHDGQPINLMGLTPTVTEPGIYELTVSNLPGTCVDSDQTLVIFDCSIETTLDATPNPLDCETALTTIHTSSLPASDFYDYQWLGDCILNGQGSPSIEVFCEGTYTLIVTNTNTQIADTLEVNIVKNDITPIAEAGLSDTITCIHPIAQLDASLSAQGADILYFWTDNSTGDTISTQLILPNITTPGSYLIEVIDTSNHCKTFDFAQVFLNNSDITLAFGSNIIPCELDSFPLQVYAAPASDFYTYDWQGPSFFSPSDSASILVDSIGTYTVLATNTSSGCTQTGSTTVSRQECIPCIQILTPDTITCLRESINLELAFCESCEGCIIQWSTVDGNIISGATTTMPLVDQAGTYAVITTDTLGFSTTASVIVTEDVSPPIIDLTPDPQYLTCLVDSIKIGIDEHINESYQWSIIDGGNILSPTDAPNIWVNTDGAYGLAVTNQSNGCLAKDTLIVSYDTLRPIANAGNEQYKTCDVQFVILDGAASSQGAGISYQWTSEQGQTCLQGDTTISPIVLGCGGNYLLTVTNNLNGCRDTSSVEVILADDIPVINPIDNVKLTCDNASINVMGNSPDNVGFTYQWCEIANNVIVPNSCQNTLEYNIDHIGNYQFEITNTNTGCQNKITINATMDTLAPDIVLAAYDTIYCNQTSIQLTAGYQPNNLTTDIIWSNSEGFTIENANSLSPTIFDASTYYLSIENTENGCTSIDSLIVIADDATPIINAGIDTLLNCYHPQITLNGSVQINTTNYSIEWGSLENNPISTPNILSPLIQNEGNYTFKVINLDNNCASIDTVLVTKDLAPPTALIAGSDTIQLNCIKQEALLDGAFSFAEDNHEISYNWQATNGGYFSGSAFDSSILALQTGDYTLTITDQENGCMDTVLFSLTTDQTYPEINYDITGSITCKNEQVTIDASASSQGSDFTNTWLDQDGVEIQSDNLVLQVGTTGPFQLAISNINNGCKTIENDIIIPQNTEKPTALILEPATINCEQMEVLLDGSASLPANQIDYLWSTTNGSILASQTAALATAGSEGIYQLIVTDQLNGCMDTVTTHVIEEATLIQGINFELDSLSCQSINQTTTIHLQEVIGGTPPFSIQIDNIDVQENTSFQNLSIGSHSIAIEDANGCNWNDTFTVNEAEELILDLGADITLELGDSLTLVAQVNRDYLDSIVWTPKELFPINTGLLEQTVAPDITTAYHIWVMDTNGCTSQDVIIINVIKPRKYFIPNAFSPNGDGHNDLAQIFGGKEVEQILFFKIFDRWGNMVFNAEHFPPNSPQYGWDGTLDGKKLNPAVFVYEVKIKFIDGWEEFKTGEIILIR